MRVKIKATSKSKLNDSPACYMHLNTHQLKNCLSNFTVIYLLIYTK